MDELAVAGNQDDHREHRRNNPHRHSAQGVLVLQKKRREQSYILAAMQILSAQYPGFGEAQRRRLHSIHSPGACINTYSIYARPPAFVTSPLLASGSEQSLIQSINDIVKPPKKQLNYKVGIIF